VLSSGENCKFHSPTERNYFELLPPLTTKSDTAKILPALGGNNFKLLTTVHAVIMREHVGSWIKIRNQWKNLDQNQESEEELGSKSGIKFEFLNIFCTFLKPSLTRRLVLHFSFAASGHWSGVR
jgi:hypothetical protein